MAIDDSPHSSVDDQQLLAKLRALPHGQRPSAVGLHVRGQELCRLLLYIASFIDYCCIKRVVQNIVV